MIAPAFVMLMPETRWRDSREGESMAGKTGWAKIKHAYICGEMSYRELAQKFGVPFKTLSEVAKREGWVTKRRQFRDEVSARAYARARDDEVDELERIRAAADKLGGKLEEIMQDEDQLFLHTAVLADMDGATDLYERKMKAVNPRTMVALAKAMKDMTAVLRDLHGLSTRAEDRADKLARDKLKLERDRLKLEQEKAGASGADRTLVAQIDDLTMEAAE